MANKTKVKPIEGQLASAGRKNVMSSMLGQSNVAYNPSKIPLKTYDDMRNHFTIAGALGSVKLPILSVDWYIDSENEEVAKFIEANLREFWSDFIRDILLAFDFGFSGFEKVFEIDDKGYIKLKKLLNIDVNSINIKLTDDGSYDGLIQNSSTGKVISIPAQKSFVFTHTKEFNNFYGRPRIRPSYTPWFISRYMLDFCNTFYERYGNPAVIGYAPIGKSKYNNTDIDNMDYMLKIAERLQNASAMILPFSEGKQWSFETFESKRTGGDYIDYIKYLDMGMFTGCLVPSLSFSSGEKGSYALFETQADTFSQGIDGELTDIKGHIDKYIIRPLVEYNFGKDVKAQWVYHPLSSKDRQLVRQVMLALVQQGKIDFAVNFLSESLGLPAREAGIIKDKILAQDIKVGDKEVKQMANAIRVHKHSVSFAKTSGFWREPNQYEKHVNFEKIKQRFDTTEKQLAENLNKIIDKQKEKLLTNIGNAMDEGKIGYIQSMQLNFKTEYENKFVEDMNEIFDAGFEDVKEENKLRGIAIPNQAKNWVNAQGKNISKKHQNDLEFLAISTALAGISKELSRKEVLYDVSEAIGEYQDKKIGLSSAMSVHNFYENGREWAADEGGLEFAEWSSVLEPDVTCDFCWDRDGMVIKTSDPDFTEFGPAEAHENCKCLWIYIDMPEPPEISWVTPDSEDVEEFYQ